MGRTAVKGRRQTAQGRSGADMSTEQSNSNLDFLDEELVAYLDGELDSQATKRLEDLLASDEPARKRLSQLANSWELLDQLPRATVDDLFTRTTVEMVALAEENEVAKHKAGEPARQRMRWLVGGAAALGAAAIGFVAMALALPDQNDPLLADLPVIYNLELYEPVGSMDFLRQLQKEQLFVKDASESAGNSTGQSPHAAGAVTLQRSIPDSIAKRREWVQSLPPEEKQELRHNLRLFQEQLTPKEQDALREFDVQLREDPKVDDLALIMQRFYEWWNTITPDERNQWTDETNVKNRIELVHQFQRKQEEGIFNDFSRRPFALKNPDDQVMIAWTRRNAIIHGRDLDALSPPDGQRGDGARPGRPRSQLQRAFTLWWSPQARWGENPPTVTDAELRMLLEGDPARGILPLSKERQEELEQAIEKGHVDAVKLVRGWIQTACLDMLLEGRARLGAFGSGGRRGFDFQRGGGPRSSGDAPPRGGPAQPDRKEAPVAPKAESTGDKPGS
jgi:hypothetical protein